MAARTDIFPLRHRSGTCFPSPVIEFRAALSEWCLSRRQNVASKDGCNADLNVGRTQSGELTPPRIRFKTTLNATTEHATDEKQEPRVERRECIRYPM